MKTEEYWGPFKTVSVCAENCGWVDKSELMVFRAPFPMIPFNVCPKCGANLKTVVGRFLIRKTTSWLSGTDWHYLSFKERGK